MRSYFPLIVELHLADRYYFPFGPLDSTGYAPPPIALERHLIAEALPKLDTLHAVNTPLDHVLVAPALGALSALGSVVTLTLAGVEFRNVGQAQTLLCALPNLRRLSLKAVRFWSWYPHDGSPTVAAASGPTLTRLAVVPERRTVRALVEWLAAGPSGASLATLIVPHECEEPPHAVLERFGSSVQHLSFPLAALNADDGAPVLERYTGLHTLTVSVEPSTKCNSHNGWAALTQLFAQGVPRPAQLRKVTISIRLSSAPRCRLKHVIYWRALGELDEVLGDRERYGALGVVEVRVQWREKLRWTPRKGERATLETDVRKRMCALVAARKLVVHVGVVQEVRDL
ncbi:hypothetical protein C8Q77DRAFT_1144998 [Trametes polyzona]|nr:hypothetical protein C8Q77DRAFT_1144998 [Trametes polyzona]